MFHGLIFSRSLKHVCTSQEKWRTGLKDNLVTFKKLHGVFHFFDLQYGPAKWAPINTDMNQAMLYISFQFQSLKYISVQTSNLKYFSVLCWNYFSWQKWWTNSVICICSWTHSPKNSTVPVGFWQPQYCNDNFPNPSQCISKRRFFWSQLVSYVWKWTTSQRYGTNSTSWSG